MTVSSSVGIYRGMCVDNLDPLKQGRIRVQVPGLLGPSASGWAFPAWAMEELGVVAEDRLPDIGQGVWVMAEGEYLYWFAVFGPQARAVPEVYDPSITWVLPVMPLTVAVTIAGVLSSPTGTPNPDPVVELQSKVGAGAWTTVDSTIPDLTGAFSFQKTRTNETQFRIHFPGTGPFYEIWSDERTPPDPPNTSVLAWTVPTAPWQIVEAVTGTITTSPQTGKAKGELVRMMVRDSPSGAWTQEGTGTVQANGTWSIPWTRTRTGAIDMKAVFMGSQLAGYAETAVSSSPVVSVPVTVTMDSPTMSFGVANPVNGTVGTALYGTPPGTVKLQTRTPTLGAAEGGTWVDAASTTPLANGSWTMSYTPNLPDADYRAYYAGSIPFQAGKSAYYYRALAQTTTTTINVPTGLIHGTAASWSGTVKDSQGKNVTSGTVTLMRRRTTGTTTWYSFATATVSNGSWTASGTPTVIGTTEWRADYGGAPGLIASSSAATRGDVGLGTVALTKGTMGHNSLSCSWNAVSGATSYYTLLNGSGAQDSSTLSYSPSNLSNVTTYTVQTRATAQDTAGAWVYGPYSGQISGYTGRPESRKSGSFAYEARPTGTGTWRSSDNWTYNGDVVVQGYYSSASNNAYGVLTYNGAAFRNWVDANYGSDVRMNLNWVVTKVAMYRVAGGTGSAITMYWHVTGTTAGSGGQPALAGGASAGSLTPGTSAWVTLPYAHWGGHVLMNDNLNNNGGVYVVNSFCLYRNNSSEYGKFGGASHAVNSCNIYVECNWNFVTVSYIAPYWN